MTVEEMKQRFIDGSLEQGIFTSGENVIVEVYSTGFTVRTLQSNGWIRNNIYEYLDNTWVESETYNM